MLKCSECSSQLSFLSLDALEVHLVKEHFNNCFIYECPLCQYAHFPTEKTLIEHCDKVHQNITRMEFKQSMTADKMKSRAEIHTSLSKSISECIGNQKSADQGVPENHQITNTTTKREPITLEDISWDVDSADASTH